MLIVFPANYNKENLISIQSCWMKTSQQETLTQLIHINILININPINLH
jgi:hypothetical protein